VVKYCLQARWELRLARREAALRSAEEKLLEEQKKILESHPCKRALPKHEDEVNIHESPN
jgi:hypothetical protein